jgi:hypothetical protein
LEDLALDRILILDWSLKKLGWGRKLLSSGLLRSVKWKILTDFSGTPICPLLDPLENGMDRLYGKFCKKLPRHSVRAQKGAVLIYFAQRWGSELDLSGSG